MKYKTATIALLGVLFTGCTTIQKSYQTSATVSPAGKNQYTVAMTIQERGEDGKWYVQSAPKITVMEGEKGQLIVCDKTEENGLFCTAIVNDKKAGLETLTTITIKENGKTLLDTSHKTLVKK